MAAPPRRSWWLRLLLSFSAGLASALLVAIVLAVVDLYLTGHQLPALSALLIDCPSMGVHLSLADLIFLIAAVFVTAITWRRTAGKGP
jgi:type II secretory pathway component PulF